MPQTMMWVFAVLIVLAMGGIALLAAGRGEPMKPAYDDRPDARVPLDRTITPDDLRRVRFSLAFRGYRMSEVDALLARVALEQELRDPPRPEPRRHPGPEPAGDSDDAPSFPVMPPPPPPE
ncbi:DivIVA domain-containing protein [Nocardioides bizhenqiangii]|uniref:DivIVA domain-containing protein n=1 Tax=Nocardioides bizhenqiangii TaxID=3095076 RepID=A0ABZ0ZU59_9ACTN|nr:MULTISPECIES: DivIVA domain-containing protein [unclassified Nocardioides]MDZ5623625.1 DivIVA domain-containing protein [Nocardioides sp. HM23]WQQ27847.1 DivIVA domain-containing protein [Nocardioides sp. HM61]